MKTTCTQDLVAAALLGALALGAGCTSPQTRTPVAHSARSDEQTPKTLNTRIGELKYEVGFPTKETVDKFYDEMDFQGAVMAYQYATSLVAFNELNVGIKQIGVHEGDLILLERFLDPNGVALTGNNTTIYAMSFLDLAKNGPMVVEVPAGSYGAFFDLWQQPIGEMGPAGADKGKGGKFVVVPMDYTGQIASEFSGSSSILVNAS